MATRSLLAPLHEVSALRTAVAPLPMDTTSTAMTQETHSARFGVLTEVQKVDIVWKARTLVFAPEKANTLVQLAAMSVSVLRRQNLRSALCQDVRSTSSRTVDESTPCTSARHSRQGGAQRWTRPALASWACSAGSQKRLRHVCVQCPSVFQHASPELSTAPHKRALPHSSLAQGSEGDPVAPPRVSKSQPRSCPGRSRDGATSVADMTAMTSAVVLWRLQAWSPVPRANQPRAVVWTRAL